MKNRVWLVYCIILSLFSFGGVVSAHGNTSKISTATTVQLQKAYLAAEKSKTALQKSGNTQGVQDADIVINALLLSLSKKGSPAEQNYWQDNFSARLEKNKNYYTDEDYSRVFSKYARKVIRTGNVKAILSALNDAIIEVQEEGARGGNSSGGIGVDGPCQPATSSHVLSAPARDSLLGTGWLKRFANALGTGFYNLTHRGSSKSRAAEVQQVAVGGAPQGLQSGTSHLGGSGNSSSSGNSGGSSSGGQAANAVKIGSGTGARGSKRTSTQASVSTAAQSSQADGNSAFGNSGSGNSGSGNSGSGNSGSGNSGSGNSGSNDPIYPLGKGLPNLGNTCFANSVHQLWYYSPVFRNILKNGKNGTPQVQVLRTKLNALLEKMASNSNINPEKELRALFSAFNNANANGFKINIPQQEDAGEYLFSLVNLLSDGAYKPIQVRKSNLFEGENVPVPVSAVDENSHLEVTTVGSQFKTIQGGLGHSLADESMEGGNRVFDSRTGEYRNAVVKKRLIVPDSGLPEELLVHVNRNTDFGEKVTRPIDMSGRIIPPFETEASVPVRQEYIPFEFVVHEGGRSAHEGHYITITHDLKTGRWWKHNDSLVTEVKKADLAEVMAHISKNAVLVNYKRAPSHSK